MPSQPNKRAGEFELTSGKKLAHALKEHLNPLPRSVTRSGQFELLDGEWKFDLDVNDKGLSKRWYLDHDFSGAAQWPGSVESHMAAGKAANSTTPFWQDK